MKSPIVNLVSVHTLKPNKRNARTHSKKQIRQIADSIQRFGWTGHIVVDENGTIIAGHGRYQAAILLGLNKVPVVVISDLSDTEKRALAVADNKIAANAGWDRELLSASQGDGDRSRAEIPPAVCVDRRCLHWHRAISGAG